MAEGILSRPSSFTPIGRPPICSAPLLVAPSKHHSPEGREHGRTTPLIDAAKRGAFELGYSEILPDQQNNRFTGKALYKSVSRPYPPS
jgi:hypothetical protein